MVGIALSAKRAQFGVLAVVGLGLVYLLDDRTTVSRSSCAVSTSASSGRAVSRRGCRRAVVDAGDPSRSASSCRRSRAARLPPARRRTPPSAARGRHAVRRRSERQPPRGTVPPRSATPRGVCRRAREHLVRGRARAHPRPRGEPRRATLRAPAATPPRALRTRRPTRSARGEGSLSFLARLPTKIFRTREYVAGDDLRRVHWRQSVNTREARRARGDAA